MILLLLLTLAMLLWMIQGELYFTGEEPRPAPCSCPVCQADVEFDWMVCPHCQCRLRESCPHCHKIKSVGQHFCPFCGEEKGGLVV